MNAVNRRTTPLAGAILGLLLALPTAAEAQRGSIVYTQSLKLDLPPEARRFARELPSDLSGEVTLRFDETASLTTGSSGPSFVGRRGAARRRGGGLEGVAPGEFARAMAMMRALSGEDRGVPRGNAAETYIRFADGAMVEVHEFLGRTFRVRRERPALEWRLTGEQAEHQGFMVMRATTEHEGASVEAWFTPEIPVSGGPGPYGGLPGMILVVSLDGGESKFFATEIALDEPDQEPVAEPAEGDEMTPEEFARMVEEKIEEMRSTSGFGRRGPGRDR